MGIPWLHQDQEEELLHLRRILLFKSELLNLLRASARLSNIHIPYCPHASLFTVPRSRLLLFRL